MSRSLPGLLIGYALAPAAAAADDVLLVGNSYTQSNDLRALVTVVLDPAPGEVVALAIPGYTFEQHAAGCGTDERHDTLLCNGVRPWDWVVLQEQSQIPGFPESNTLEASLTAAAALDGHAAASGAETVWLATWGRRDGDAQYSALYPDFQTMNALLWDGYQRYAETTSTEARPTWIAPVGLAFATVWDDDVAADRVPTEAGSDFAALYIGDGSHPSLQGSYLAACVLAATITGESPVGRPGPDELADADRDRLQAVAARVVLEETPEVDYPWERDRDTDTDDADTDDTDTDGPPDGCGCAAGAAGRAGWPAAALAWLGLARRRCAPAPAR